MKKHNFYAGPSILSEYAINETINAIRDYKGTGLSILEISHRSKEFEATLQETKDMFKEILNIPSGYQILFLGGGASLQFLMIPFNLLKNKAAYLNTGTWASKALKEAKGIGNTVEVASSKDANFNYIPKGYTIPADADYFHITTNNTIFGTQIRTDMDSPVPLVADASSDIFCRPMDVSKYAMIYGGAQKNLAPAGMAFVIIREDILGKVDRYIPTMLDYKIHIDNESMYNTPPVINIYTALQSLKWIKSIGGLDAMYKRNMEKADMLYNEIDRNKMFKGTAVKEDRSIMNVCFVMNDEYKQYEEEFGKMASAQGLIGLKGHRSVGGFRASIYNAMGIDGVAALVKTMQDFEKMH